MQTVYTAPLFVGAFLLFSIQPIFAKALLPILGGSPAVWGVCMASYQFLLFLGYLYAYVLTTRVSHRHQSAIHFFVLLAPILFFPLRLGGWMPPGNADPKAWALGVLFATLGAPFFVLSTTAPLLQRWFSLSMPSQASHAYFLYRASNLGSLIALLAYPFWIEPRFTLGEQVGFWSVGYVLFVLLAAFCCAQIFWRAAPGSSELERGGSNEKISRKRRLRWLFLALVPSSYTLGVTTYITTDIAAIPLLWIAPLGIYLLTFILVFSPKPLIPHAWVLRLSPFILGIICFSMGSPLAFHLAGLFFAGMLCHGELAQARPEPYHLAEYYVWISLGGALGGVFNALLAPIFFTTGPLEYPIAIALTFLALPGRGRYLFFGAAVSLFIFSTVSSREMTVTTQRSFFGISSVKLEKEKNGDAYHILMHGNTRHGAQSLVPGQSEEPLSYYYRSGPLGEIFSAWGPGRENAHVAVIGLGAGSMASYAREGESWDFFEVDPVVVRLAEDPRYFRYLSSCAAPYQIILGDGRLSLGKVPDHHYDLILIDAFSSDGIPLHLMTREALQLYFSKMRKGGLLVFHISNRHLNGLQRILAAVSDSLKLEGVYLSNQYSSMEAYRKMDERRQDASKWFVMAENSEALGSLARNPMRMLAEYPDSLRPWSDDFSNILDAIPADWK